MSRDPCSLATLLYRRQRHPRLRPTSTVSTFSLRRAPRAPTSGRAEPRRQHRKPAAKAEQRPGRAVAGRSSDGDIGNQQGRAGRSRRLGGWGPSGAWGGGASLGRRRCSAVIRLDRGRGKDKNSEDDSDARGWALSSRSSFSGPGRDAWQA
jgi:hypothetical protein